MVLGEIVKGVYDVGTNLKHLVGQRAVQGNLGAHLVLGVFFSGSVKTA